MTPLTLVTTASRQALLAATETYIVREIAADRRVTLLVPNAYWQLDRKLMAARCFPAGVDITTPEHFFDERWQLYGDGRAMVSAVARQRLLATVGRMTNDDGPEAARHFPRVRGELTPGFLEELETLLDQAAFLPEFEAALLHPSQRFSASEQAVMDLCDRYFHELAQHRLIDRSEAEYLLSGKLRLAGSLVFEGFESLTPRQVAVIGRLARRNEVRLVVEYDTAHPGRRATRALIDLIEDAFEGISDGTVRMTRLEVSDLSDLSDTPASPTVSSDTPASPARPGELCQLADRLYTDAPGIKPTGAVWVGECRGACAQPAVVASLIERALEDHPPADIVLVLKDPAAASPLITRELVARNIPFVLEYALPLVRTALGAVLLGALELFAPSSVGTDADSVAGGGDGADFARLSGFLASPYAGLSRWAAWDCQRHWREQRGSTAQARLEDAETLLGDSSLLSLVRQVTTQSMGEQWIVSLLELLNLMLKNAVSGGRRTELGLAEDQSAARTLLAFAEKVAPLGEQCAVGDLSAIPVSLTQRYVGENCDNAGDASGGGGDPSPSGTGGSGPRGTNAGGACSTNAGGSNSNDNGCITITAPHRMGLRLCPVVVMGDLDADSYPMSERPSPLDGLALKLGVQLPRDLARRQRALLLHLIEAATSGFAFYRATHGAEGELRQSVLWDELLANYHPLGEESVTVEPERIPATLEPFTVRRYEAAEFWQSLQTTAREQVLTVNRGQLSLPESRDHLFRQPLSVTSLESYVRCPYHWFVEKQIGPASIDGEFGAAFKGSFAHEVLNDFYQAFLGEGNTRVDDRNLSKAQALLDGRFAHLLEEKTREGIISNRAEAHEMQLMRRALLDYLARDATLLPGYAPRYLEQTIDATPYAGVLVRGRIDRLDINAEGQAVIIDYKLSSTLSGYGIEARRLRIPDHIQGAIYATLVERVYGVQVLGTLYRSFTRPCTRGVFSSVLVDVEDGAMRAQQGYNKNDALPRLQSSREDATDPAEAVASTKPTASAASIDLTVATNSTDLAPAVDFPTYLAQVENLASAAVERLKAGDIRPRPRDADVCTWCLVSDSCPVARSRS
jgi:hypothetical protein